MNIKSSETDNFSDISHVCIVISKPKTEQLHTGFFFRNIKDEVKFLHLAWFNCLFYEDPNDDYYWLDIPLEEDDLMQIQLLLEEIHDKNGKNIPYGIAINEIKINDDGTLKKADDEGLTCATFVLRALEARGYNIIDLSSWEIRPEDKKWQEAIIKNLEYSWRDKDTKFIESQKKYIGKVPRFKPNEVVAAANSENTPLNQKDTITLGEELLDEMKKMYGIQQGA